MPNTFLLPLFLPAWNPGKTQHTRKHKAVASQDPTDLLLKWSFYESNSVLNVQRSVLTELLFPKKSLWVWHLARPNGVPGSSALMTCRCGVALWKSCLVPDGVWGKGWPVPAEDMGTVADWAGWEEGEEKRGALGKMQVKRKELWIHWKPPGRTLKTDKGKIKQTKQRRGSLGNSRSISCYHESPHLLSIWCRDGPGLDDLTTFSLFSSFVAEQISLLIINRKPEAWEYCSHWLWHSGVQPCSLHEEQILEESNSPGLRDKLSPAKPVRSGFEKRMLFTQGWGQKET